MKNVLILLMGGVGGVLSLMFGGFDDAMITLLIFLTIDFISGLITAGVFKKSNKTPTGGLSSSYGVKGLAKKGLELMIVVIAVRLDKTTGLNYFRDCTVFAICTNELISIIENLGLCGVPVPNVIKKAIDVLNERIEP